MEETVGEIHLFVIKSCFRIVEEGVNRTLTRFQTTVLLLVTVDPSIAVLVATTTLAMGVNLPARLVVVKGTNHYRGAKGYQELPRYVWLRNGSRSGNENL